MPDHSGPKLPTRKPCAFCGYDTPRLYERKKSLGGMLGVKVPDRYLVGCPLCGAYGPTSNLSILDAIRLWNVRAVPTVTAPATGPNVIPFRRRLRADE